MSEQNKSIGSLWYKEAASGVKYLSGNIEINGKKIYIAAFKNTKKPEGSKQPDFRILLSGNSQRSEQPETDEVIDVTKADIPF